MSSSSSFLFLASGSSIEGASWTTFSLSAEILVAAAQQWRPIDELLLLLPWLQGVLLAGSGKDPVCPTLVMTFEVDC